MSEETKLYRLTNNEPGPRGVETGEQGLVMVGPTPKDTTSSVMARLTEQEYKNATRQGLECEECDEHDAGVPSTSDLPADGHVNLNHPDAAKVLETGEAKSAKAKGRGRGKADNDADKDSKQADKDAKRAEKELSKMNRSELDEVVKNEGVDVGDASTNAEIVDKIEAHRKSQPQS